MERNKQLIYYRLFLGDENIIDEDHYETGENEVFYSAAEPFRCSVSRATGTSVAELFGTLDNYDKIIITEDTNCPIDENSVLIVDDLSHAQEADFFDYVVKRVAESLNFKAYAISKVDIEPPPEEPITPEESGEPDPEEIEGEGE